MNLEYKVERAKYLSLLCFIDNLDLLIEFKAIAVASSMQEFVALRHLLLTHRGLVWHKHRLGRESLSIFTRRCEKWRGVGNHLQWLT